MNKSIRYLYKEKTMNKKIFLCLLLCMAMIMASSSPVFADPVVLTGPIYWDGNFGEYLAASMSPGTVPTYAMGNLARGSLVTAIGSGEYGADVHTIAHINDGNYGNSYSWINADLAAGGWVGVDLGELVAVNSFAFSRSNTESPVFDRVVGVYEIQYTTGTGDRKTWTTLGTVEYNETSTTTVYRKQYFFPAMEITGFRILMDPVVAGNCIDEIELYKDQAAAKAFNVSPSNGAVVDSENDVLLDWKVIDDEAAGPLTGYHVYFDPNILVLETAGDKGIVMDTEFLVAASELDSSSNYYWRIDAIYEVNGEPNVVEGEIWSFQTASEHTFAVQAFYEFEDTNEAVAVDSSGNGKDMFRYYGVFGDPNSNYYSGEVAPFEDGTTTGSQSMYFAGCDSYMIEEALTGVDNFVFEAYVKPLEALDMCLLMDVGGWANGVGFAASVSATDNWGALVGGIAWVSTPVLRDSFNWAHIALVKGSEFNGGQFTLFVNHEKVYEFSATPVVPDALSFIGSMQHPTTKKGFNVYKGLMDNVRFSTFTGLLDMADLMPAPKVTTYCGMPGQVYKTMDLNKDCYVDMQDLMEFIASWMNSTLPTD